jgi:hypothetical protein
MDCNKHEVKAKVEDVFTGTRKKKHQGTVVQCTAHSACSVFGYDADDAVKKWNDLNKGITPVR